LKTFAVACGIGWRFITGAAYKAPNATALDAPSGDAVMNQISTLASLDAIWSEFEILRADNPTQGLALAVLEASRRQGLSLGQGDVEDMLRVYSLRAFKDEAQFKGFLALLAGEQTVRIQVAYRLLKIAGKGQVTLKDVTKIFELFGLTASQAEAVAVELSADGSEHLSEMAFVKFLPEDFSAHPKAYHGGHSTRSVSVDTPTEKPKFVAAPMEQIDSSMQSRAKPVTDLGGTSPLQMQIGFFRLLQGAAYRCFRASYSANSETHLRAYDLPYTIFNFADFANAAIDYYRDLGIVQPDARQPLEDLRNSINAAVEDLRARMENWNTATATPEMLLAEARLESELSELDHHHQIVSAAIELILSGAALGHSPSRLTIEDLQIHELNRLRHLDDHREVSGHQFDEPSAQGELPFIETWQRVIIDESDTHYSGAIMPSRYWYEDFMPKLLRACSVCTLEDIAAITAETEADLDSWYQTCKDAEEFTPFAVDVLDQFPRCAFWVKQEIKQAWRLTRHYLNGVQKRREREEFGRDSGYLSEYVTFIDVYLGRRDIADSEMRISFPYFIGPATWRFLHTSAEIVANLPAEDQGSAGSAFKTFFGAMATVYPCPYCRFHLNRYVVQNGEVHMYPVEYLLLGPQAHTTDVQVTIHEKLNTVSDGHSLRMFLWKLHNTVSSSIARSESWYHRDEQAHYTSRYWPSLDSEIARATAIGQEYLETHRIQRIYGVMKHAAHLAIVRDEFKLALSGPLTGYLEQVIERAEKIIPAVENAILGSRFLQETYHFNPNADLDAPHFSAEEEALARSGYFVEA
jgi:hypothetical protein